MLLPGFQSSNCQTWPATTAFQEQGFWSVWKWSTPKPPQIHMLMGSGPQFSGRNPFHVLVMHSTLELCKYPNSQYVCWSLSPLDPHMVSLQNSYPSLILLVKLVNIPILPPVPLTCVISLHRRRRSCGVGGPRVLAAWIVLEVNPIGDFVGMVDVDGIYIYNYIYYIYIYIDLFGNMISISLSLCLSLSSAISQYY